MAKKQSMNLFEAHLEKVAIGAAGLVFLWVVVTRFFLPSGIETTSGTQNVVQAAQNAAKDAEDVLKSKKPTPNFTPKRIPTPENPTKYIAFYNSPTDTLPLGPIHNTQIITNTMKDKIANFPTKIPAPQSLSVGIYHTRASTNPSMTAATNPEDIKEVDFVTVEGTFALGQIRSLFQQSFQNPELKDPVAYPDPIVAAVELDRSQLMPDGSWSAWQHIPRLDIDPGAVSDPSEDFQEYSTEKYNAILTVRKSAYMQKRILQPEPYALVNETWLPPTEQAKQKEEEAKSRRAPGGGANVTPGLPGLGGTGRTPIRPTAPGSRTRGRQPSTRDRNRSMYRSEEEESYGGRDREYRSEEGGRDYNRGGYTGRVRMAQVSSQDMKEAEEYLKQDEVTLWAHDASVVPGVVYRYQMRLGFFNPIAGTDRFLPEDIAYKNKIILWSDFLPGNAKEQKFVQIDKRVLFFPRTASSGDKVLATVDVFRQHDGKWYQRPYTVIPGSTIGGIDPPLEKNTQRRTTSTPVAPNRNSLGMRSRMPGRAPGRTTTYTNPIAAAEPEKIDFRTGVTIIDITPKTVHWYSSGSSNSLNQQTTPDLVYRDVDGYVKRVPVDNRCWPDELRKQRADILKQIREEEKSPREVTPQRPGPGRTPRRGGRTAGGGMS